MRTIRLLVLALSVAGPACAQTNDPFPAPIAAGQSPTVLRLTEFATIPDFNGAPPRMMHMLTEPGTRRLFVSDMNGVIYNVSYDARTVRPYLDLTDARWGISMEAGGGERGVQSFAFHPQFGQTGSPGFGKLYTWMDMQSTSTQADFGHPGENVSHHTVLFEWTAQTPGAATYDGAGPRALMRFAQPYGNHNGGMIGFNPLPAAGTADYGLLYIGVGDGGSGGDPQNVGQNLAVGFAKILRIDPLGTNSQNGQYGIPAGNPFAGDNNPNTLEEIYAYGVRNPQRFAWDPQTGTMLMADIGQNVVETLNPVPRGGNLGWNLWEGSFRFVNREVLTDGRRGDPNVVYPIAEYDQVDPTIDGSSAATGVHIFRGNEIPELQNTVLWGDLPTGQLFYVSANPFPNGGQNPIRRILFDDGGQTKTFLQLIQEKNVEQGREPASRADMRFGAGPDNQLYLINKRDGVIRQLVSGM